MKSKTWHYPNKYIIYYYNLFFVEIMYIFVIIYLKIQIL